MSIQLSLTLAKWGRRCQEGSPRAGCARLCLKRIRGGWRNPIATGSQRVVLVPATDISERAIERPLMGGIEPEARVGGELDDMKA